MYGDDCVLGHKCPYGSKCHFAKMGMCKFVGCEYPGCGRARNELTDEAQRGCTPRSSLMGSAMVPTGLWLMRAARLRLLCTCSVYCYALFYGMDRTARVALRGGTRRAVGGGGVRWPRAAVMAGCVPAARPGQEASTAVSWPGPLRDSACEQTVSGVPASSRS